MFNSLAVFSPDGLEDELYRPGSVLFCAEHCSGGILTGRGIGLVHIARVCGGGLFLHSVQHRDTWGPQTVAKSAQ